ncbi:hypothetical protein WS83_00895 [Burkholderia sp. MSMB2042]|uniref:Uncharacterized protein n=1 Tax=Burkholderia savannae TaxID=1637837 RepID=A0ABR5T4F4_9BURK|nr:hypothetical protein WS78_21535 [Burkholderia savannae]KVG37189.1 hypothetical protein WS77_23450 [Burkholderia sp. MSMB0265]KVG94248.1 hypothetical protein WS83_00895 [Burkholderia sp. MSMB2042]KVG97733.1 hypothetical protein WS82_28520 [Burkholderia sp. MSMB2041]KWZ38105.1 hypothetical protein WS72_24770 [Burkholderia savannae]
MRGAQRPREHAVRPRLPRRRRAIAFDDACAAIRDRSGAQARNPRACMRASGCCRPARRTSAGHERR